MKALLREPLLHFLILGAAVFAVFRVVDETPAAFEPNLLEVTESDVSLLSQQFEATWRRPPTEREVSVLIDSQIEEEVLVREAQALGLDQGDTIIRRRLAQKMTFLLEGSVEAVVPTETELAEHLAAYPERFRKSALIAFEQVLLTPGETETDGDLHLPRPKRRCHLRRPSYGGQAQTIARVG